LIKAADVLKFLRPNGGWTIYGEDFDSIIYDADVEPITKAEFDAGFAQVNAWKTEQEAAAQAKREAALAKLEALGLDEDDLKALGL